MTAAHNTSSTSLFISWQPPDLNTIHGEFEGYKISYRPRDIAQAKAIEIPIENPKAKVSKSKIKNRGISFEFSSLLKRFLFDQILLNCVVSIVPFSNYL